MRHPCPTVDVMLSSSLTKFAGVGLRCRRWFRVPLSAASMAPAHSRMPASVPETTRSLAPTLFLWKHALRRQPLTSPPADAGSDGQAGLAMTSCPARIEQVNPVHPGRLLVGLGEDTGLLREGIPSQCRLTARLDSYVNQHGYSHLPFIQSLRTREGLE